MSQMLKSSGAMAAATMTSRVLGMVRVMVYATFMGNGPVASAFTLAFMVPNLFRRLLGEGALTAAFIPIFKQKEIHAGKDEMWRTANVVISGVIVAAGAITGLAIVGISTALYFGQFSSETTLMLRLLRFMFPYMLLVCVAAVLIGMANARGHFFVPALGSVMLNVIMIASVLLLAPLMGVTLEQQIFGLAIGVVVAGLAQMVFQLPSLSNEGYRYQWLSPWRDATVRDVMRKMIPGSIGVAAFQINVLVTQSYVFFVDDTKTINSTFEYAVRLMELPQGIFGISLATFLLPTLSGLAAEKKFTEFQSTLKQGLSYLSFSNLIAAAVSLALAEPIVRLLFEHEHGKFGPDATQRVALALMCLAPGLLLFSMNNILARAFFALNDIKTPMKISVFCLVLNLVIAVYLVQQYREAGLAIANTISAMFNTGLLFFALRRKLKRLEMQGLIGNVMALIGIATVAGGVAYFVFRYWNQTVGHDGLYARIGAVFVPGILAGVTYWLLALAAKVPAAMEVTSLVRRKLRK